MPIPTFALVWGMPVTGKSHLAEQLGTALGWPFFTKDGLMDILSDVASAIPR